MAPRWLKKGQDGNRMAILAPTWEVLVRFWPQLVRFWGVPGRILEAVGTIWAGAGDIEKHYKNCSFSKVFGCTTHLPKWLKMLPKSAPGPPKTGQVEAKIGPRPPKSAPGPPKTRQVEAKIGPRPPKLGPRWPSCCHLGPSWARLCASWRQLCWNFSEIRRYIGRKLKKLSQEPLQTFIFCIFGASGGRFS